MSNVFTNPDPRLRHANVPPEDYASQRVPDGKGGYKLEPYSYFINERTFPALHARVREMQGRAGVPQYRLVAVPYQTKGTFIDFDNKLINVGIANLNAESFEAIAFAFAHEVGHQWRFENRQSPGPRQIKDFPKVQWLEVEADILGTCMTGDKPGAASMLSHLPPPQNPDHPHSDKRIAAVMSVTEADCAIFNLAPAKTPGPLQPTSARLK